MNVLVLGGNGLFGRKTVIRLTQDKDVSVVVSMDVVPTKEWVLKEMEPQANKFKFVRGDVSDLEDILTTIKQYAIDRIINFAFILPGETLETNPRLGVKVNELGMCNSFEAARLMGISRVVYASSEGVYGPQGEYGDREVTEDDKMHPGSAYAIAKQLSEILADQYHRLYGINFTALRPCIGYGHGGLTPLMIRHFCELVSLPAVGKPFSVEDDGTTTVSLSAADDVAALAIKLTKMPASPHPAYNVGGPPTSMQDVAKVVRKYIPEAQIKFGKQPPPADRDQSGIPWIISSALAKKDLGFSLLSMDKAVLLHINDARTEAELPLIKGG
jgi:nucleoside-diphosphate-sugar epimerase